MEQVATFTSVNCRSELDASRNWASKPPSNPSTEWVRSTSFQSSNDDSHLCACSLDQTTHIFLCVFFVYVFLCVYFVFSFFSFFFIFLGESTHTSTCVVLKITPGGKMRSGLWCPPRSSLVCVSLGEAKDSIEVEATCAKPTPGNDTDGGSTTKMAIREEAGESYGKTSFLPVL